MRENLLAVYGFWFLKHLFWKDFAEVTRFWKHLLSG